MNEILSWLVATVFMDPLFEHAYACEVPRQADSEIVFSYEDDAASVANHRAYANQNPVGGLTPDSPGGTSAATIGQSYVEVKWIQDAVQTRIRLPSGEIVDDATSFNDPDSFANRLRYHAVIPTITTHTFDKQKLELTVEYEYLFPARRVIEQKFGAQPGLLLP